MEPERLNDPSTSTISLELLGHHLQFSQDPNSRHHGTTVWDASMVFAKYLEKNCRRGRFCPSKLRGKRAVEIGAGCGVAGFGMAMLGCDVVATDQAEVVPLLKRNVERNTSNIDSASFGSIQVAELYWGNKEHIKAVDPPFDFIIGTDVVYSENLLEPLLKTILALSGPRTTVLLCYEFRSTTVHEQMLNMWRRNFDLKSVTKAKMDSEYQHPSIHIYIMNFKPSSLSAGNIPNTIDQNKKDMDMGEEESEANQIGTKVDEVEELTSEAIKEDSIMKKALKLKDLSDWEARRYGSMAARLLRDVKIT